MIEKEKPLKCPSCGKSTNITPKSLQYYRIPNSGVRCNHCDFVVIPHLGPVCVG